MGSTLGHSAKDLLQAPTSLGPDDYLLERDLKYRASSSGTGGYSGCAAGLERFRIEGPYWMFGAPARGLVYFH